MSRFSRREFIHGVGTIGLGAIGGATLSRTVRAEESTVSGRLLSHDGDPVTNSRVQNYGGDHFQVYTDSDGYFSGEAESGSRLHLVLYREDRRGQFYTEWTGVPHVYTFRESRAEEGGTDLGEIRLPQAHLVRLKAVDSDGEPIRGGIPDIHHGGAGIGSRRMSTESDGWAYLDNANSDGIELTGNLLLGMEIPADDGGARKYEIRPTIDEPTAYEFQIGEGVTELNAEQTETQTATSSTATETPDQTPTEELPTQTPTEKESPTQTPTSTVTPTSTEVRTEATPMTETESQRGFLSNNPSKDLGPLDNPFYLTVGGFALSVAGIIHNMVRGY